MFKIKTLLIFIITFSIYNLSPILSQPLELVEAFPNLTFTRPVLLTHSNDGTDRIFILEQRGVIKVFSNDSNVSLSTTFMDIVGRVDDTGNEMGLLGLAFHPDYANNRYFYVDYTDSTGGIRKTRISRFTTMAGNPNQADTSSELVLLEIPQPYSNHNGGMIFFGLDGFLY
nr:PQQ-dependent sugar dehydrogenase [Bacteroidota bacterium]